MSDVDLGNIFYSITANDNTQGGITSAITSAAASFDFIVYAAQTMVQLVQEAYQDTIGAAIDFSDQMIQVSDSTGVSTDNLQRLKAGSMSVGVTFDQASQSLRMFSQKIDETGTAGDTLRSRLEQVGVSVTDSNGNMKDTYSIYTDTIEKLGEMPNTMERNNLALSIFGRSWSQIAPMMTDYKTAADAAAGASPIPDDTLEKTRQFGIDVTEMQDKIHMAGVTIGTEMVPALTNMINALSPLTEEGGPVYTFFSWLNGAMEDFTEEMARVTGGFMEVGAAVEDIETGHLDQLGSQLQQINSHTEAYITSLRGQFDELNTVNTAQTTTTDQTNDQVDAQTQLTQATKDYTDALTKEEDEQKSINELTSNYLEDMADTGRDVAQARSLTSSYKRSMEKDTATLATDQGNVTKYGDIIIQLGGKTLGIVPGAAAGASGSSSPQKLDLTQKGYS